MSKLVWRGGNMLYPVPAVMVSCSRQGERPDIVTAAWTGTVCSDPPMVSVSLKPQRFSHDIIRDSGEFVINLTTEKLARAADWCGVKSGRDTDKFKELHLTEGKPSTVHCPLIGESPVNIECAVTQIIPLGSHDLFLAEVKSVDIDEKFVDRNGRLHLEDCHLIVYSHGEYRALGDAIGTFGFSVRKKPGYGRKSKGGKELRNLKKGDGKAGA